MDMQYALEKLGLSDKEARVYLAGLALGSATVQELSKRAKIKRTTVYEVLQVLKSKELFRETIKNKKRLFIAAHPNQLKVDLNDKQSILEKVFHDLSTLAIVEKGRPHVVYYDSLESIHRAYEEALKKVKKETLGIGSLTVAQNLGEGWLNGYIKKRKKLGIIARTLVDSDEEHWHTRDFDDKRVTRVISGKGSVPVNIEVFDDTVLITSLEGEMLGLSIESKKVSKAVKTMLELIWDSVDAS